MGRARLVLALRLALAVGMTASSVIAAAGEATVYTREQIEQAGYVTLDEFLQRLPNNGPAANTRFNGGGNGETRVNLRGLGSNRTLVLIDGRRTLTTLDGATDLSTLPLTMVERVEITTGSGAARYGANAVGGVVNIVTRAPTDGAQASAYVGESQEGDGRLEAYDFAIGADSDRGSVSLGVTYTKQESIVAGDRDISAVPLAGFSGNNVNAGASSATPYGQFSGAGIPGTVTLIPGRSGNSASDFRAFNRETDGYNFVPDNFLQTPSERTSLFAQGRYQLSDAIAFATKVLFNERSSGQQFAPIPLSVGSAAGGINSTVTIPASNVFNPFGVAVTRAQFRNPLLRRSLTQDVDTFYFNGGFDGAFELFDRAWSWDLNYLYADNEQRGRGEGLFSLDRLRLGLGPSFHDAQGVARCGTPAAPIAGCVPLDIFHGPAGYTQEMIDYASFIAQDNTEAKLHDYIANLSGEVFELPAGPVRLNVGYENRRETGFDQPDAFVASGQATGSARPPISGTYSLDDLRAQFTVPILKDVAGAQVLEISVAARYSDYSTFGGDTNPEFGFRWQPIVDLEIHGAYVEGIREPGLSEMFTAQFDTFPPVVDLCDRTVLDSLNRADVTQRCRQGIGGVTPVPGAYGTSLEGQVLATDGGNPDLQPEHHTARQLGIAWRPAFVEGLGIALDWQRIRIGDLISPQSAQHVLNACYLVGDLNACRFIARDTSGDIVDIFVGNQNSDGLEQESYDFDIGYGFDSSVGKFLVDWRSSYTAYLGEPGQPNFGDILPDGDSAFGNLTGVYFPGQPNWRLKSNVTMDWQRGDWGATLGARYLSALDEDCFLPVVIDPQRAQSLCSNVAGSPQHPFGENQLDSVWYFDLQARWDTPWNARIAAGVHNLTDEDPPVSYSGADGNFDQQYEIPGRFWYASYTQRF